MRTTKEEREEQREALREGGWVNDASTDRPAVVDVDFVDQADALYALLDDVDAVTTTLTTIATAAGLPADASAEEVVARVGEMREAERLLVAELRAHAFADSFSQADQTPAEQMRAAAVVLCEDAATRAAYSDHADATEELADLAAAIRALPLPEEAPLTPREKLRRVREAERYQIATVHGRRVYAAPAAKDMIGWWFQWEKTSGKWVGRTMESAKSSPSHDTEAEVRAWVLDTLRAEGWDVVEEGEGDG